MNKKKTVKFMKKSLAGLFALAMVVSGISVAQFTAKATSADSVYGNNGTYADTIIYEEVESFEKLWEANEAPGKAGYVFGGWCKQISENKYEVLDDAGVQAALDADAVVCAKFVPAYVLSVKIQVDATTAEAGSARTNSGSIRLISSIDSKNYQAVGFKVLLGANKYDLGNLETTTVYTGLKKSPEDTDTISASAIFGAKSAFLSVWRLDGIGVNSDKSIIDVTPYWITMDGTKVTGITKYVHMEDGYNDNQYMNVTINLDTAKKIAAGALILTYPEGLDVVGVEYGDIFSTNKMVSYDNGTNTIKFVGKADVVGTNVDADGVYVNVRFKNTGNVAGFKSFFVTGENFCDWNEKLVTIDAWDIQY